MEKFIGDAVMAVFGIPQVQEDDALRAVRAAAEIRERLPAVADEVGVELRFRTGVNTGPVLMGEGENLAIGDAVNVAARLEQAARARRDPDRSSETLRLVRDAVEVEALEPLALKGKARAGAGLPAADGRPGSAWLARHLDAPLVGPRARAARSCADAWERTVAEVRLPPVHPPGCRGGGQVAAGGGAVRTGRRTATRAARPLPALRRGDHVLAAGRGADAARRAGASRVLERPAQRRRGYARGAVLGGRGGCSRRSPRSGPVILHVDDLQWAEPMLLDLLDHVVDLSRGAPILVLCTARPELLEDRPGWGGGKLNATTVLLEPLGAEESQALLDATRRRSRPGRPRARDRRQRGQPTVPGGDGRAGARAGDGRGAADDPGAAGGAAGTPRRRRARAARARRGRGRGVPPLGGQGARPSDPLAAEVELSWRDSSARS